MTNISPIETNFQKSYSDLLLQNEYEKDGVCVVIGGITGIDGFAFLTTADGKPLKGIITNGKLRRSRRRRVVKTLLTAFRLDKLGNFPQFGSDVRGAVVLSKGGKR